MERQDPQGEENGDHNLSSYQYLNRLAGADPALFQNNPLLRMQLQHHYHQHQQHMMRPSLYLGSGTPAPMSGSRMATPTAGPMLMNPKSLIESPGVFPNAIMPRSLHDELWAGAGSRIRPSSPMVTSAGGTLLPMSMSGAESSLSKLNPSVYSHPNAHDPVLMLPKSLQGRDFAVLGGRRANVDVTSSGAFFDPRAVSKPGKDNSQMDILAQLTREMRLQQQAGRGLFPFHHLLAGLEITSTRSKRHLARLAIATLLQSLYQCRQRQCPPHQATIQGTVLVSSLKIGGKI